MLHSRRYHLHQRGCCCRYSRCCTRAALGIVRKRRLRSTATARPERYGPVDTIVPDPCSINLNRYDDVFEVLGRCWFFTSPSLQALSDYAGGVRPVPCTDALVVSLACGVLAVLRYSPAAHRLVVCQRIRLSTVPNPRFLLGALVAADAEARCVAVAARNHRIGFFFSNADLDWSMVRPRSRACWCQAQARLFQTSDESMMARRIL
jgi:hypothetical protein